MVKFTPKLLMGDYRQLEYQLITILITSLPTGFYLLKSPKNTLLMGFFSFTMGQRLSILFQLTLSSTWNTSFFGKTGVGVSYPRRKK